MGESRFDAIVMLTWSNWRTEMRSNRYHYATRFARDYEVIFVQPDLASHRYSFEPTEVPRVTLLHLSATPGSERAAQFQDALREKKIIQPLLWIYNHGFRDIINSTWSPLRIYHATEAYLNEQLFAHLNRVPLLQVVHNCDLLVAVSEGIEADFRTKGGYLGPSLVLSNGCDFPFWSGVADDRLRDRESVASQVAFYQGGISTSKFDFHLLTEIARRMPDWEFWLCGRDFTKQEGAQRLWRDLRRLKNVRYLGELAPQQLQAVMRRVTVGLIPFIQSDWIIHRSLPLKAFEYLACGLPVVTVPIRALEGHSDLFCFASDADQFIEGILKVAPITCDSSVVARRIAAAQQQDYDPKYDRLTATIAALQPPCHAPRGQNVLVLYDPTSMHVSTVQEHLNSFSSYSASNIYYAPATGGALCGFDMSVFDAVVIHYSVRVSISNHLSASYAQQLQRYGGLKILFIQDEYDTTDIAHQWLQRLGIHVVYTALPNESIGRVYPSDRFQRIEFIPTLTGYVPDGGVCDRVPKPLAERKYLLGYRGRELPYWYGALGHEKLTIGIRMKEICAQKGVPANIEWSNENRIYGDAWYDFIADCRAVLGTESGSYLFDFDGSVKAAVTELVTGNPSISFEEVAERCLKGHDDQIKGNVISPKIFEAISLRTGLVLFEGDYSGVIRPNVHYLPLKKDYSNVDEVLEKLHDVQELERMTTVAYEDVVASGMYSYRSFIREFDELLARRLHHHPRRRMYASLAATVDLADRALDLVTRRDLLSVPTTRVPEYPIPPRRLTPLLPRSFDKLAGLFPDAVRRPLSRLVRRMLGHP